MGKGVNGCRKGKDAERKAARFLRDNGFPEACRSSLTGVKGAHDLDISRCLPDVALEVKHVHKMRLGTKVLADACDQARATAANTGKKHSGVLWFEHAKDWRLTYMVPLTTGGWVDATVEGDDIVNVLKTWQCERSG